jgi:hypothetical protein
VHVCVAATGRAGSSLEAAGVNYMVVFRSRFFSVHSTNAFFSVIRWIRYPPRQRCSFSMQGVPTAGLVSNGGETENLLDHSVSCLIKSLSGPHKSRSRSFV